MIIIFLCYSPVHEWEMVHSLKQCVTVRITGHCKNNGLNFLCELRCRYNCAYAQINCHITYRAQLSYVSVIVKISTGASLTQKRQHVKSKCFRRPTEPAFFTTSCIVPSVYFSDCE